MKTSVKISLTLVLFVLFGCNNQINQEDQKRLDNEIEKVNQSISEAISESQKYQRGSSLWGLSSLRLSIYKQTLAMLEQKKNSTWYYPVFNYTVDGATYSPPKDLESTIKKLENDLKSAQHEAEIAKAKAEVAGGLMGALVAIDAETKALAVSQLNYQLIAYRNGFPPYLGKSNANGNSQDSGSEKQATVNTNLDGEPNEQDGNHTNSSPKDFRKVKWGMNKDEVKKTETGIIEFEDDHLFAYPSNINGIEASTVYFFAENKLVRSKYVFKERHSNKNDYIDDYVKLSELLSKKYGKPEESRQFWLNDLFKDDRSNKGLAISLGHLNYFTRWELENTTIFLGLTGENNKIELGIEYSSKNFKGLEESERSKKSLEAL